MRVERWSTILRCGSAGERRSCPRPAAARTVQAYRAQPIRVRLEDGGELSALCYNLPEPPSPDEHNPQYAAKLRALAERIGLPAAYVSSIE